jgi:hypothetical protein
VDEEGIDVRPTASKLCVGRPEEVRQSGERQSKDEGDGESDETWGRFDGHNFYY